MIQGFIILVYFQLAQCRPVDMDGSQIVEGPVMQRIKREALPPNGILRSKREFQSAGFYKPPVGIAEREYIQRSKREAQFTNDQNPPLGIVEHQSILRSKREAMFANAGPQVIQRSKREANHAGNIPPPGLVERQNIQRSKREAQHLNLTPPVPGIASLNHD